MTTTLYKQVTDAINANDIEFFKNCNAEEVRTVIFSSHIEHCSFPECGCPEKIYCGEYLIYGSGVEDQKTRHQGTPDMNESSTVVPTLETAEQQFLDIIEQCLDRGILDPNVRVTFKGNCDILFVHMLQNYYGTYVQRLKILMVLKRTSPEVLKDYIVTYDDGLKINLIHLLFCVTICPRGTFWKEIFDTLVAAGIDPRGKTSETYTETMKHYRDFEYQRRYRYSHLTPAEFPMHLIRQGCSNKGSPDTLFTFAITRMNMEVLAIVEERYPDLVTDGVNMWHDDANGHFDNLLMIILYRYREVRDQQFLSECYTVAQKLINWGIDLDYQNLEGMNVLDFVREFGWENTPMKKIIGETCTALRIHPVGVQPYKEKIGDSHASNEGYGEVCRYIRSHKYEKNPENIAKIYSTLLTMFETFDPMTDHYASTLIRIYFREMKLESKFECQRVSRGVYKLRSDI